MRENSKMARYRVGGSSSIQTARFRKGNGSTIKNMGKEFNLLHKTEFIMKQNSLKVSQKDLVLYMNQIWYSKHGLKMEISNLK